jgi:glutathione S-transferase
VNGHAAPEIGRNERHMQQRDFAIGERPTVADFSMMA